MSSMTQSQRQAVAQVIQAEMNRHTPRISITDLSLRTGLSRGTVGAIYRGETGRLDPTVINLICDSLDIPVELVLKAAGFNVNLGVDVVGLEVELAQALEGKNRSQQRTIAKMIRAIER